MVMKAKNMQKKAAREIRRRSGSHDVQVAARQSTRTSVKAAEERRAAGERQVAEMERTFTPRYEW
jgi:hypothetical protein